MESKELHTSFAQVLEIEELKSLPLVLRIPDLMRVLGIGRNSAYDLVHSNQIHGGISKGGMPPPQKISRKLGGHFHG